LLVVIAIIAVLIGLLLPAVQKVREAANRIKCANNLKQLSLGMHNFHDANKCFPWGRSKGALDSPTWAVILLPYIEQQNLWKRFTDPVINGVTYGMITRGTDPVVVTHNLIRTQFRDTGAMKVSIPLFVCPARRATATVSETYHDPANYNDTSEGIAGDYAVNYGSGTSTAEGNNGAFRWNVGNDRGVRISEITDGTSNTFLIGEKHVRPEDLGLVAGDDFCIYNSKIWTWSGRKAGQSFPLAISREDLPAGQFGSWHIGIVQFAFCDGRVQSLSTSTSLTTLGWLAARDDGMVIPSYD
jgi:hypothetical protein